MIKFSSTFIFVTCVSASLFSQEITRQNFVIPKISTFYPDSLKSDDTLLSQKEHPIPDGQAGKRKLQELKKKFQFNISEKQIKKSNSIIAAPIQLRSYSIHERYVSVIDSLMPITGGTPLDNTMAISDEGIYVAAINSKLFAYDVLADTPIFKSTGLIYTQSFSQFANQQGNISTYFPFDPKLLYDPVHNRFIFTFLSGFSSADSKIVVAFSSTSKPSDPWYIYEIPGNPRNTTAWTDYPAITISKNNLFLTVNLILEDSSWQAGFDGSIIWQIGLDSAYAGANDLKIQLWDNIKYNQRYIRNLNPVSGALKPLHDEVFFISNRNFDYQNDTLFLIHLSNASDTMLQNISIKVGKLNTPYGLPPNGVQEDTDLSDPTGGLQTNDARWLGAVVWNNMIQFVGNSMHFEYERAGIYHGTIKNIYSNSPEYSGTIIGSPMLDYAYPNIAFCGIDSCEIQTIIGFDHSSKTDYAGVSCIYYSNSGKYSDVLRLKSGENYIDNPPLQNDPYERWGDYFGIQRKYNEPGKVWVGGFFGLHNKRSSMYVAELLSPDTHKITLHLSEMINPINTCEKTIFIEANNATPPLTYYVNNLEISGTEVFINNCSADTHIIKITDLLGCEETRIINPLNNETNYVQNVQIIYPNPFSDIFYVNFYSPTSKPYMLQLFNLEGKFIASQEISAIEGENKIQISLPEISSGFYRVIVSDEYSQLIKQSILKIGNEKN